MFESSLLLLPLLLLLLELLLLLKPSESQPELSPDLLLPSSTLPPLPWLFAVVVAAAVRFLPGHTSLAAPVPQ